MSIEPMVWSQPYFDVAKAQKGARVAAASGCPVRDASGRVLHAGITERNISSKFQLAPASERYQEERITGIVASIDVYASEIQRQGNGAIEAFNAYLASDSSDANDINWVNGQRRVKNMGDLKFLFLADMDDLIINAPNAKAAAKLCGKKMVILKRANNLWNADEGIKAVLLKSTRAMNNRSLWEQFKAWLKAVKHTVVALITAFIQAIQDAVALIQKIFSFAKTFFSFIAKYPKTSIAIGGVVALGVLGFIIRPYISIAEKIF